MECSSKIKQNKEERTTEREMRLAGKVKDNKGKIMR